MQKLKKFGKGLALAGALSTGLQAGGGAFDVHPDLTHDPANPQDHVTMTSTNTPGVQSTKIHYPVADDGMHLTKFNKFGHSKTFAKKFEHWASVKLFER